MSLDPALITSIGGVLLIFGAGIKWLLNQFNARLEESEKAALKAREALDLRLSTEISALRGQIAAMEVQKMIFLRRIYQLEAFIHRLPGVDIPDMTGWPL